jgi:phospholipase C
MDPLASRLTRRSLLRAGGGLALGAALGSSVDVGALGSGFEAGALARGAALRRPDSLPDPARPAGEPTNALPFDHIVFVMQENHSFDSYLGMLARHGQPLADGFTFDGAGAPINSNPYKGGYATVQHVPSDCTLNGSGSQSWDDTHAQINGGRMDGFAATGVDSMAYWDQPDIPFYYSMAKTFCLANRWFCSAPCQTYPNRRFLQAGTAFGLISTDTSSVTQYPPNGTIWDRLTAHGISWADYYTQVPTAAIILDTVTKYPQNMLPIARFYSDCATGALPSVSMVDSAIGGVDVLAGLAGLDTLPGAPSGAQPSSMDQDEENGNVSEGENFVSKVVNAVLGSPLWPRILLVWLYDEHGGNYDHVPPPAAIPPDAIPPKLSHSNAPGGYDIYGPRVPAVVVSGHARPHAVTNVVHDHTSVLATIEAKWNLPALTHRDANAATLADFLLPGAPTFPEPPSLAAPSNEAETQAACDPGPLDYVIHPYAPTPRRPAPKARLQLRVLTHARDHAAGRVVIELRSLTGRLTGIEVELEHGHKVLGRAHQAALEHRFERITLHHRHLHPGRYSIVVKFHGRTLLVRRVHLTRSEV